MESSDSSFSIASSVVYTSDDDLEQMYTDSPSSVDSWSSDRESKTGTDMEVDQGAESSVSSEEEDEGASSKSLLTSSRIPESLHADLMKPIHPGSSMSVLDSYLLVMQYALRHSLTKQALTDLLDIVRIHLPSRQLVSQYRLKKLFMDLFSDITSFDVRHCCGTCHCPLPTADSDCQNGSAVDTIEFLTIPVASQLKRKMEDSVFRRLLARRFEGGDHAGTIADIYDGKEYRKHSDFLSSPANVSLTVNTDGVSVFHSSNISLWPIWLVVNELPPSMRFSKENMLLAGLWFAREKPTMTTFLRPLMDNMNELYDKGTHTQMAVL